MPDRGIDNRFLNLPIPSIGLTIKTMENILIYSGIILFSLIALKFLYSEYYDIAWCKYYDYEQKRYSLKLLTFVVIVLIVMVLATSYNLIQEIKFINSNQ